MRQRKSTLNNIKQSNLGNNPKSKLNRIFALFAAIVITRAAAENASAVGNSLVADITPKQHSTFAHLF